MTKEKDLAPIFPASLVFLKPAGSKLEPYTTHEIIADCAGVQRKTVSRLIQTHQADLETFGILGFEIAKITDGRGRPQKLYHLNEQQATLLITYLRNTPAVTEFKKELVRQFYAMREELTKRRVARIEGKTIHRSLTDALKDSGENERMRGHAYGTYTNLAYILVTGKRAVQLRKERGAARDAVAADFLTSDELAAYQKQESAITALLDAGLRYDQIKNALSAGKEGRHGQTD